MGKIHWIEVMFFIRCVICLSLCGCSDRSNVIVWLVLLALLACLGAILLGQYDNLVTASAGFLGVALGSLAAITVRRICCEASLSVLLPLL